MSAEARERIRQAQIKRWAALNATKANMNATVAPLPKAKKKAAAAALLASARNTIDSASS
jgi:hypothetical protein